MGPPRRSLEVPGGPREVLGSPFLSNILLNNKKIVRIPKQLALGLIWLISVGFGLALVGFGLIWLGF